MDTSSFTSRTGSVAPHLVLHFLWEGLRDGHDPTSLLAREEEMVVHTCLHFTGKEEKVTTIIEHPLRRRDTSLYWEGRGGGQSLPSQQRWACLTFRQSSKGRASGNAQKGENVDMPHPAPLLEGKGKRPC